MVAVVIATLWTSIGDSEISTAGWLAMALGVIVTLALGVGLMALVFVSNRRGYDELAGRDR
jgi:high-affinity Fe2+/Pb2+ permease